MNVLITGGSGFIGSHVAEYFYEQGHTIYILDYTSSNVTSIPYIKLPYNILEPICEQLFADYQFDVVVHLAAQVSVSASFQDPYYDAEVNIIGLIRMLELSKKYHVKQFIFASSAAVYGDIASLPIEESMATCPISPYGISKLTGERYCKLTQHDNMNTVILRFSNVYGPRQTVHGEGGVIINFVTNALTNAPIVIHGNGLQTRDFIYVKDVAAAIYKASFSPSGTYNISTATETSVTEIAHIITTLRPELSIQYGPQRPGDIQHSRLSYELAKQQLDWHPRYSFEQGLHETYEWFQQQFLLI